MFSQTIFQGKSFKFRQTQTGLLVYASVKTAFYIGSLKTHIDVLIRECFFESTFEQVKKPLRGDFDVFSFTLLNPSTHADLDIINSTIDKNTKQFKQIEFTWTKQKAATSRSAIFAIFFHFGISTTKGLDSWKLRTEMNLQTSGEGEKKTCQWASRARLLVAIVRTFYSCFFHFSFRWSQSPEAKNC